MKSLKSTLLHTLELAAVFVAAFALMKLFNLRSEDIQFLITVLLGALVKFARVSPKVPVDDYVNPKE